MAQTLALATLLSLSISKTDRIDCTVSRRDGNETTTRHAILPVENVQLSHRPPLFLPVRKLAVCFATFSEVDDFLKQGFLFHIYIMHLKMLSFLGPFTALQ